MNEYINNKTIQLNVLRSTENINPNPLSPTHVGIASPRMHNPSNPTEFLHKLQAEQQLQPKPEMKPKPTYYECNFDKDPTKLYLSIQHKRWTEAEMRAKGHPDECKTWVSRYEDAGNLRWRLLPLHAAVIFKAPQNVIHALLCSYPYGARQKDDQGMLAIHLAFRNESPVNIARFLLMAYPQSIEVQDRKGRIPLTIIQNSKSPLKDEYMEVLNLSTNLSDVASAAVTSSLEIKSRKKLGLNQESDAEKLNLMAKIDALQHELDKTQGASEILVNHINTLEAQLCSKSDTETYMTTKVTNMDSTLRETTQAKELAEASAARERMTFEKAKMEMDRRIYTLEKELSQVQSTSLEQVTKVETQLKDKSSRLDKYRIMEKECEAAKQEVEEMERILKKKIESEHTLANQVATLASRLAESTAGTHASTNAFQKRIDALVEEKASLKKTVEVLTLKVTSVLKTLEFMAKEHDKILALSSEHQKTMEVAQKSQATLAENAARNEQMMIDAAWEREEIVRILTKQAKQVEKSSEERKRLMDVVEEQNQRMEEVSKNRSVLVDSIKLQKGKMASLQKDINLLKKATTSEDLSFISDFGSSDLEDSDLSNCTSESVVDVEGSFEIQQDSEETQDNGIEEEAKDSEEEEEDINEENDEGIEYVESEEEVEQMLPCQTSTLTDSYEDLNSEQDDSYEGCDENEEPLSLAEIENSVDKICSEAARLVASMPSKN